MAKDLRRTLVITNDFGPRAGGIESFVQALVERLPEAVIYTSNQPNCEDFDRAFQAKTGAIIVRDRASILLPSPRVARTARRLLREHAIERVWFGAAAPLALMSHSLRKAGATTIVATTHGHEVWWARTPLMRQAIRYIGNHVDVLTYLGDYTASHLRKALSPRARLERLAPGVDTDHFAPANPHLNSLSDPVLVCVSRLVHRKGQDRLIEALPIIRRTFPGASLLLVGTGPLEETLRKRARKLGLEAAIHFTGRASYDDLPALFSSGDLFVMPTRSRLAGLEVEGLGMVYLEASACGLPVIAGRSGGSPDAVIPGKTGLLVNDDVEEIAATCVELLADPDRMKSMGSAGREWVLSKWQWSTIAADHQRLLDL